MRAFHGKIAVTGDEDDAVDGVPERVDPVRYEVGVVSGRRRVTKVLRVSKLALVESSISDVVVDPKLHISYG